MKPATEQRFLRGNFAPIHVECDAPDLAVEGEFPRDLRGTLFRNGPNPQYPPRDRYHMFSGDGMVHAFQIADGRVSYHNRWMRTEKFERERAAGRALFGTFGNPATSEPEVYGVRYHVANTNVVWHGGRLFALEEFNPPFEINPRTLESKGRFDYAGKLSGPMTAHPKVDPHTGELHFFGYALDGFGSKRMAYHVADGAGHLIKTIEFDAPYASMVHDFIVTEHYVLFPIFPLTVSTARARGGGPLLAWEPTKPTQIGLLSRAAEAADLTWYEGDPCLVFHPLNGFEENGTIIADMLKYEAAPGFPGADGSPPDPTQAIARLERWRFPLGGTAYTTTALDDQASEYPRLDERFACHAHRYGYFATTANDHGRMAVFDQLARYDFRHDAIERYTLPKGDFISEPIFVPRTPTAPEGDGYLLAVAYRGQTECSDLVIFDAGQLSAGPQAIAHLETRVPFGFHGNWMPG
jgi:carotenoid cleavage dioxygenase-like enzyme